MGEVSTRMVGFRLEGWGEVWTRGVRFGLEGYR